MKPIKKCCISNHTSFAQSEYFSFFGGGLLGIILFLFLYGTSTLDVTNVDWLLQKGDLSQHYLGWCFYRNSDWLFPIGLANTLSYPLTSSVIYTDSIPILAVFFKLFRDILPESFQYFGWFVLIVYFLQGAISALLVYRLTGNAYYGILSAVLFLLSAPFFQRTFGHTSLSSHYLLLLSLLVLLTRRNIERTWRGVAVWSGILVLAAGTHFHFAPIVGCILLFYAIKVKRKVHKRGSGLITFFIPVIITFTWIWLLGGLTSDITNASNVNTVRTSISQASANLNTFINKQDIVQPYLFGHSTLHTATSYQYEGFGYLGMGVLVGLVLLLLTMLICWIKPLRFLNKSNFSILKHFNVWALISLSVIFFLLALSPTVTCGNKVLFTIPVWKPIEITWSIFRSTGRLIWMPAYILMLVLVIGIWRFNKIHGLAFCTLSLLICLQIADVLPWMKQDSRRKYATTYCEMKDYDKLDVLIGQHKHVCLSALDDYDLFDHYSDILRSVAKHQSSINAFYFARNFKRYPEYVATQADSAMRNPSGDCLYVLTDGMPEASSDLYQTLNIRQIGPYVIGTKKKSPTNSPTFIMEQETIQPDE